MSKITIRNAFPLALAVALVFAGGTVSNAQEENIAFPIAELGNCTDKDNCKRYCENGDNMAACLDFARKNGLMEESEIRAVETMIRGGGPGGCASRASCEAYCDNMENIDVCVAFAEKNNMIPQTELAEIKKVQSAIKRGVKPPPCSGKKGCDAYCSDPSNMESCITFALEAGFMEESEKDEAQKMLQAIKKGVKPLPCKSKEQCESYCSQDAHMDECIAFGEAAGFMTPEEAIMAKKMRGRGGPGGCKGKEECDAYCRDNEEECVKFGMENGTFSDERKNMIRDDSRRMSESFSRMPSAVEGCIKSAVGEERFEKMKSGSGMPTRQMGEAMKKCFEQHDGQRNDREESDSGRRYEKRPPEGYEGRMPPEGFERGMMPPEGYERMAPGPDGQMMPPPGYQMPEGSIPPPGYVPPPTETTRPQSEGYVIPAGTEPAPLPVPTAEPAPAHAPTPVPTAEPAPVPAPAPAPTEEAVPASAAPQSLFRGIDSESLQAAAVNMIIRLLVPGH